MVRSSLTAHIIIYPSSTMQTILRLSACTQAHLLRPNPTSRVTVIASRAPRLARPIMATSNPEATTGSLDKTTPESKWKEILSAEEVRVACECLTVPTATTAATVLHPKAKGHRACRIWHIQQVLRGRHLRVRWVWHQVVRVGNQI